MAIEPGHRKFGIEAEVALRRAIVVFAIRQKSRLGEYRAQRQRLAPARMRKDHIRPEAADDRMFSLRRKPDAERKFSVLLAQALAEIDPNQPVTNIMTMDAVLAASVGDFRFYMQLLGIFAGVAVLLAAIGIYGVMSYSVSERTHEIGIRVALGAHRGDVLALIGKLWVKLTFIGVGIGVALALGVTRLISSFLFGVKPTDPLTYAAVAVGLAGIAMLACYIPARRALKVDPIVALRYE